MRREGGARWRRCGGGGGVPRCGRTRGEKNPRVSTRGLLPRENGREWAGESTSLRHPNGTFDGVGEISPEPFNPRDLTGIPVGIEVLKQSLRVRT